MRNLLITLELYLLQLVAASYVAEFICLHLLDMPEGDVTLIKGTSLTVYASVKIAFYVATIIVILAANVAKRPLFIPHHRIKPDVRECVDMALGVLLVVAGSVLMTVNRGADFEASEYVDLYTNPTNIVAVALIGPVFYDFIFRHTMLRNLMGAGFHPTFAVITSAVIFGLGNAIPVLSISVVIESVAICMIYLRMGDMRLSLPTSFFATGVSLAFFASPAFPIMEHAFAMMPVQIIATVCVVIVGAGFLLLWRGTKRTLFPLLTMDHVKMFAQTDAQRKSALDALMTVDPRVTDSDRPIYRGQTVEDINLPREVEQFYQNRERRKRE